MKGYHRISALIEKADELLNASFIVEGTVYKIRGRYLLFPDYDLASDYYIALSDDYDGLFNTFLKSVGTADFRWINYDEYIVGSYNLDKEDTY